MDLHAIGINDSEMYFNYGIICLVIIAVCILLPIVLNFLKVKAPLMAGMILKGVAFLSSIGLLICIIMYVIEKSR